MQAPDHIGKALDPNICMFQIDDQPFKAKGGQDFRDSRVPNLNPTAYGQAVFG
jgi:hypothetical protein